MNTSGSIDPDVQAARTAGSDPARLSGRALMIWRQTNEWSPVIVRKRVTLTDALAMAECLTLPLTRMPSSSRARILAHRVVEFLEDSGEEVRVAIPEIVQKLEAEWCREEWLADGPESEQRLTRRVFGDALRAAGVDKNSVHDMLRGVLKAETTGKTRYHFVEFIGTCCISLHMVARARRLRDELGLRPTDEDVARALKERAADLDMDPPTDDDVRDFRSADRALTKSTPLTSFCDAYARFYEAHIAMCRGSGLELPPRLTKRVLSGLLASCGGVAITTRKVGLRRERAFLGIALRKIV
jgi:hypothetical protein